MATPISRSPTSPLSLPKSKISCPYPFQWKSSNPTSGTLLKRRQKASAMASVHGENDLSGNQSTKKTQSLQLQGIFGDHQSPGFSPKQPQELPRPLSLSDLATSESHGSRIRVAYQGVPGAYSESAAAKAYPNCEAVPCEQFETAFQAVERWLVDRAVLPIENSLGGSINRNYDLLLRHKLHIVGEEFSAAVERWLVDRAVLPIENSLGGSIHRNYDLLLRHKLHIVGEVQFTVRHCLLANHGVEIQDLRRVISHYQALAQCENTLTKLGVVREAVDDTAGAAQFVATQKLKDTGAVASALAAEIYGLNVLSHDIQDNSDNVTRFLMLAREPVIPGTNRPFKTSIVFSLEEGPGVLFKALAVFALRDINLTKIESRPQRKQPLRVNSDCTNGSMKYFDYTFYVDFEASTASKKAQNALRDLEEFATFLRVLGSYPMDTNQS